MPRCAQVLLGALTLLLHQTIGLTAALEITLAIVTWAVATPAALVIVASLAAWHLSNFHGPQPARARA